MDYSDTEYSDTKRAFETARIRSRVAAAFKDQLLDEAITEAKKAGMSIRQTAKALDVPHATIGRRWDDDLRGVKEVVIPEGAENEWREAHAYIWGHDPVELANIRIPRTRPDADPAGAAVAQE